VDQQVLAGRVDRGDRGARFRAAPTAGIASYFELYELLADKCVAQPGRHAEDRVALGHDGSRF
jgi:hypothetical protein